MQSCSNLEDNYLGSYIHVILEIFRKKNLKVVVKENIDDFVCGQNKSRKQVIDKRRPKNMKNDAKLHSLS